MSADYQPAQECLGIVFPDELAAALELKEGDVFEISDVHERILLTALDPELAERILTALSNSATYAVTLQDLTVARP